MIKHLFVLTLLHVVTLAQAQDFAITNERQNTFTIAEENPITIAVNNCPCKDLKVTAISAEVIKLTDRPCRYNIIPDQVGKTVVTLLRKSNNKVIGREEYRVLSQKVCLAFAGKCGHGKVKKKHITPDISEFHVVTSTGADYDPGLRIQQFTISIARSNKVIFAQEIQGSSLSPEAKQYLTNLQQGDIIKFEPIICKWPDGKIRGSIESAEFEVID